MSEANRSLHRPDEAKSLGEPTEIQARISRLSDPHMRPLVEAIRAKTGLGDKVPNFDPAGGGVEARCLFLLEAPGKRVVRSGFVSRNNPDETAKNFFKLNQDAGIPRTDAVIWNIVPWYIGSGTRIRSVVPSGLGRKTATEAADGGIWLSTDAGRQRVSWSSAGDPGAVEDIATRELGYRK